MTPSAAKRHAIEAVLDACLMREAGVESVCSYCGMIVSMSSVRDHSISCPVRETVRWLRKRGK
jgi:hypothetical protein